MLHAHVYVDRAKSAINSLSKSYSLIIRTSKEDAKKVRVCSFLKRHIC